MKSPYTRPFDHPTGCGCLDCEVRQSRQFAVVCIALIIIAVASFWIDLR